jgi:cysteine desulfurase / selenocysteine lyase
MPARSIDVAAARAETPGCELVAHLNNAGAALMPQRVVDTVVSYLRREATSGGYETAQAAAGEIDGVYRSIASLLGCAPDEIAALDSATRAWTAAFSSFAFEPGDRVLTHRIEYASNVLQLLQAARRAGVSVEIVRSTPTGEVDVDALASMLDDRVRLVAITHVATSGGLVNPVASVGALTRATGVPFMLDACQSVGQIPLDVDAIGCDFLAATSRKFLRGPRGTGFLYARRALADRLEPGGIDLHSARWTTPTSYELEPSARRFEQFERAPALWLGLGTAVSYALELGLDAINARVVALAARLRELLPARPGVTVRDEGREQCGIVTFTVDGRAPAEVAQALRARGVNVWTSTAETNRLDLAARGLDGVVRASVHYYNTEAELDRCAQAL